jgi:DNA gyrase/topoisomerase IV subunit A
MKKLISTPFGEQLLDLTAEEIAQREQDAIQAEQDKLAREQKEANKIAKKESAKAKLLALGLDEEEIKAIIGA